MGNLERSKYEYKKALVKVFLLVPGICRLEQSMEESVALVTKEGCSCTVITVLRLLRDK